MLIHHGERSPGALAHGATKISDIQRVRRQMGAAELRTAHDLQVAAARHRDHAAHVLGAAPRRGRLDA
jgi:hypothetical protein